ncbi:MAG TPA: signal peptidase I [Streptosporangiaceae bacterium]|nr:signal peptidase I [Streptosporangiaceae bacterium]
MNDDQSMRDRVAGRPESGNQAEGGTGSAPVPPASQPGPPRFSGNGQPAAGRPGEGQEPGQPGAPADGRRAAAGAGASGSAPSGKAAEGQAADDQAAGDKAEGDKAEDKRGRSFWRELPILIVVALIIALLIKTFVVQAFYIPSSSMENTLLIGDKVLVNKIVYHVRPIHAGDVIVFDGAGSWNPNPPAESRSSNPIVGAYDVTLRPLFHSIAGLFGTAPGQTDYIKRVIGVPGDRVACCNAQGRLTVNGVALHERSYLYPGAAPSQIHFSVTVPPGRLWVMGDNRQVSDDSRLHRDNPGGGTVPENKVIGRAFLIVWPPSRWRVLDIPSTFDQPGITKAAAAAGAVLQAGAATPVAPLAAGLVGAVPLTLLQRRIRLRRRRARGPRARGPRAGGPRAGGLRARGLRARRPALRRR